MLQFVQKLSQSADSVISHAQRRRSPAHSWLTRPCRPSSEPIFLQEVFRNRSTWQFWAGISVITVGPNTLVKVRIYKNIHLQYILKFTIFATLTTEYKFLQLKVEKLSYANVCKWLKEGVFRCVSNCKPYSKIVSVNGTLCADLNQLLGGLV